MATPEIFLANRTAEAEVDLQEYRSLLRWLTFVATQGDHYTSFGKKDVPQLTWDERRSDDDVLLSTEAFPLHATKGLTHIQLFAEGHPTYGPYGINAVVGTRDDENLLRLVTLSSDNEHAWVNDFYTCEPISAEEFSQLVADFHEVEPRKDIY